MRIKKSQNSNMNIGKKNKVIRTAVLAIGTLLLTGCAVQKDENENTMPTYSQEVEYNVSWNDYLNYSHRGIRTYDNKNYVGIYFNDGIFFKNLETVLISNNQRSIYTELENEIADAVIRGDYGNGEERKKNLEEVGYDYERIQTLVNLKCYNQEYTIYPNGIFDPYWDFVGDKVSETKNTLETYNNWLATIGSDERLTEGDLEIIEANTNRVNCNMGIVSLKYLQNEQNGQVGEDYLIVENENGKIELLAPFPCEYDLLTGNKREDLGYTILNNFEDYIKENDIQTIGFVPQEWSSWADSDVEFIREYYGEDILECLKENGFPLTCYDVEDIYKAYEESKSAKLGLYKNE